MERYLIFIAAACVFACGGPQKEAVSRGDENACPIKPGDGPGADIVEGRPDLPAWVKCLSPPMKNVRVSSVFLDEGHVYRPGGHSGIDIPAGVGTMVFAPAPGRVTFAGATKLDTNIVTVRIDPNGDEPGWTYRLVHLRHISVKEGERVRRGQVIGLSGGEPGDPGSGPCTTGPHLHYSLHYKGALADPLRYTCGGYHDRN